MIAHQREQAAQPDTISAEALHYSLIVEWDPRGEGVYVVTVPELPGCRTHGATYAKAIEMAQEAIESWVSGALEEGWELPTPHHFADRDWDAY